MCTRDRFDVTYTAGTVNHKLNHARAVIDFIINECPWGVLVHYSCEQSSSRPGMDSLAAAVLVLFLYRSCCSLVSCADETIIRCGQGCERTSLTPHSNRTTIIYEIGRDPLHKRCCKCFYSGNGSSYRECVVPIVHLQMVLSITHRFRMGLWVCIAIHRITLQ